MTSLPGRPPRPPRGSLRGRPEVRGARPRFDAHAGRPAGPPKVACAAPQAATAGVRSVCRPALAPPPLGISPIRMQVLCAQQATRSGYAYGFVGPGLSMGSPTPAWPWSQWAHHASGGWARTSPMGNPIGCVMAVSLSALGPDLALSESCDYFDFFSTSATPSSPSYWSAPTSLAVLPVRRPCKMR